MSSVSNTIRNEFPNKKIVVIGDLVADQFLRGTIDRVSREAPVFIMKHNETETLPGGAANAVQNVAALGANAVAVGLIGQDANGLGLLGALKSAGVSCDYIVSSADHNTTTKVRVLAGQHYARKQQVIRIDYENDQATAAGVLSEIKQNAIQAAKEADAIILSDYGYGVANDEIAESCLEIASERNIPVLVDSRSNLSRFKGATAATPNQEEAEHILGEDFTDSDCTVLCADLELDALLLTRGSDGMLLVEKGKDPVSIEAVGPKEPLDVTGAGDTVIAVYALGLASGMDFRESARLANHAGGIVVMKRGTATLSADELIKSLEGEPDSKALGR